MEKSDESGKGVEVCNELHKVDMEASLPTKTTPPPTTTTTTTTTPNTNITAPSTQPETMSDAEFDEILRKIARVAAKDTPPNTTHEYIEFDKKLTWTQTGRMILAIGCMYYRIVNLPFSQAVIRWITIIFNIATLSSSIQYIHNIPKCCGKADNNLSDGGAATGLTFTLIDFILASADFMNVAAAPSLLFYFSNAIANVCIVLTYGNLLVYQTKSQSEVAFEVFNSLLAIVMFWQSLFTGPLKEAIKKTLCSCCCTDEGNISRTLFGVLLLSALLLSGVFAMFRLPLVIFNLYYPPGTLYYSTAYIDGTYTSTSSWDSSYVNCSSISYLQPNPTGSFSSKDGGTVTEWCNYQPLCCVWEGN